jgi:N4-gp56 family major capsid protein
MATSTYGTLTAEQRTFYVGVLIKRLIPYLPLIGDGQKVTIPKHMGLVANFRKYGVLSLATTPLSEGVTPAGNSQVVTAVTATAAQYGDFLTVSDVLETAGIDDSVVQAVEQLGEQAGQTVHRLVVNELGAGSTVRYGGAAVSRITVAVGMNMTVALIRLAVRDLENQNVPKFSDGFYHAAVTPSQKYDLVTDPAWQDIYRYTNTRPMMANEVGEVYGALVRETTDLPIYPTGGAAGIPVHAAVIYGPNAYGVIDLESMGVGSINDETNKGVQVFTTGLDVPSKSDPLHQRAYVGWSVVFVAKVLDTLRVIRIETSVSP